MSMEKLYKIETTGYLDVGLHTGEHKDIKLEMTSIEYFIPATSINKAEEKFMQNRKIWAREQGLEIDVGLDVDRIEEIFSSIPGYRIRAIKDRKK